MPPVNVERYCQQNAIKLTPLRQAVLNILATQEQPLTAYKILDKLKQSNPKAQVMSVYRVLDFLQTYHLIHRIENLNAFMLCHHLSEHHSSQWLICEQCGNVVEYAGEEFNQAINTITEKNGFTVTVPTIELKGVCADCQRGVNS